MSLINEALKKAQRQHGAPPASADYHDTDEPSPRVVRRSKPLGFDSLITRFGLGALLLIAIIAGGFFVAQQLTTPAPETKPANAAVAVTTPPSASAVPAPSPTPEQPLTVAFNPAPATLTPVEPQPIDLTPTPAPSPDPIKPAGPARMDTRAIAFIEGARISGIRASATDSKVLMNDRLYRIGDTVEHELEIKLVGIASNALTFENAEGARYTRNF